MDTLRIDYRKGLSFGHYRYVLPEGVSYSRLTSDETPAPIFLSDGEDSSPNSSFSFLSLLGMHSINTVSRLSMLLLVLMSVLRDEVSVSSDTVSSSLVVGPMYAATKMLVMQNDYGPLLKQAMQASFIINRKN